MRTELEPLQAARNEAGKRIGEAKRAGRDAAEDVEALRALRERIAELDAEVTAVDEELARVLAGVPNLPAPDAAAEDEVLREVGDGRRTGRDHLELLDGLVDLEAGAKAAGSRFAYLKGPLVMLELALVRWAMELLEGRGFTPVITPALVREEALFGTGFLPDTEQQIYRLPDDDLYLAGTSEVALASIHAGEIVAEDELPLRYVGF